MGMRDVAIGPNAPTEVHVVVEMPQGSSNKYEYDFALDAFVLDRALYSALFAPADYGWVAETIADDGDPLDILVMSTFPAFPGCVIWARPVGMLMMSDEKGRDEKILSVSARDPRFEQMRRLEDVPEHMLKEIAHYFRTYKELEEKVTEVLQWEGVEAAYEMISRCRERYEQAGGYTAPAGG